MTHFLRLSAVSAVLALTVLTCMDPLRTPEQTQFAEGEMVHLTVNTGEVDNSRALTTPLAKAGYDYIEVIFHNSGRYYRAAAFKGQPLTISIPTGTYNAANAVMFAGYAGRRSYKTLLAVGTISNPSGGVIGPATQSVTFTLQALTADVTKPLPNTLSGKDNTGEIVDYAAYPYQYVDVDGKTVHFYRLDAGLNYTLDYMVGTSHGAAIYFQSNAANSLTPVGLGTLGSQPLVLKDPLINLPLNTNTLADVGGKLPITFNTSNMVPAPPGYAGLKFSVPVSALAADTTLTGGHVWHIQGGLSNDYLDAGFDNQSGDSGGGILFAVGNPKGLTTTIRGKVKSDVQSDLPGGNWTLNLYQGTPSSPTLVNIPVNLTTGEYTAEIPSLPVPGGTYFLRTEGAPERHQNVETLPFKLVDGQQKTVDIYLEKTWSVTSVASGITGIEGIAAVGEYVYVTDFSGNRVYRVLISNGSSDVFAGDLGGAAGADNGMGTAARFQFTTGIVASDVDTLLVGDRGNVKIRSIEISTQKVSDFANSAAAVLQITVRGSSVYWQTAASENDIRRKTGGTVEQVLPNYGGFGIASNNTGRFLYAYKPNVGIMRIDTADGNREEILVSNTEINEPHHLALDPAGEFLYVANGQVIRKVKIATKQVSIIAGSTGASGDTNNLGPDARFTNVFGITFVAGPGGGNLYVTDKGTGKIKKLTRDYN